MSPEEIDRQVTALSFMLDFGDSAKLRLQHAFRDASHLVSIPADQQLFMEGDSKSNDGYVLLSGAVVVRSSDGFSKTVRPPALVGEMKQFHYEGNERSASVFTVEESLLLRFNWDRLNQAASERLTPDDLAQFKKAVELYAWMHYLEQEDDSF